MFMHYQLITQQYPEIIDSYAVTVSDEAIMQGLKVNKYGGDAKEVAWITSETQLRRVDRASNNVKIYDISNGNRLAFSRFTSTNYLAFATYNPHDFTIQFGVFSLATENIAKTPVLDRQFTSKPRILLSSTRESTSGEIHVAICSSDNPYVVFLEQMVINEGVLT